MVVVWYVMWCVVSMYVCMKCGVFVCERERERECVCVCGGWNVKCLCVSE
jgi:hypothetical protein